MCVTLTHRAPTCSVLCERRAAGRRGAMMDRRGCAGLRGLSLTQIPHLAAVRLCKQHGYIMRI